MHVLVASQGIPHHACNEVSFVPSCGLGQCQCEPRCPTHRALTHPACSFSRSLYQYTHLLTVGPPSCPPTGPTTHETSPPKLLFSSQRSPTHQSQRSTASAPGASLAAQAAQSLAWTAPHPACASHPTPPNTVNARRLPRAQKLTVLCGRDATLNYSRGAPLACSHWQRKLLSPWRP